MELTYNYDHGPYVVGDGFAHIALSTPDLEALHPKSTGKVMRLLHQMAYQELHQTIILSKTLMDTRSKSFVKNIRGSQVECLFST